MNWVSQSVSGFRLGDKTLACQARVGRRLHIRASGLGKFVLFPACWITGHTRGMRASGVANSGSSFHLEVVVERRIGGGSPAF